jgi:signal transduction histidine kinase/CheY-like chemotaxis protein
VTPDAFAAATDLFADPALLVAPDGTVRSANAAAAEHLGVAAEALRGRPLGAFVASAADDLAAYLRACARSRQKVPGALTTLGAEGRAVAFRAEGRLLRPADETGEALILVRLVPKETAAVQFVALTERVERLTHEVARRKKAEADLLASSRHKDEFLALLAHELRNPLAPILNGIEVLRLRGDDGPTRARALDMIARQARHLSHMVDDLLDVARITQGKVRLARERVDLARLVRATVADHRGACDAAAVTAAVETPPAPVWVHGDPTRLAQVVANLLTNACKFTDAGGRVEVRVSGGAGRAEVRVRDTGAGIEPALLPRLFEPFAQADRTLNRAGGGLGLGLALVKGLAELHGGGAAARSDGLGRGSEFSVWLPLEAEPAAVVGTPPAGPAQPRRRVLVIEDNRDAAESLRMLLELLGHEVRVAHTGPDGVRAGDEWRPDVIVCDIGLPGLDGYGVALELGRLSVRSTARLIALTGYGDEDSRRRAAEVGFHHHLTKPANIDVLRQLLVG